jgi:hypothetical protein
MHATDPVRISPEAEPALTLLTELICELQALEEGRGGIGRAQGILADLGLEPNLRHLPKVILTVYGEIGAALRGIRLSRETIQSYSLDRLRDTHSKLSEVSSTTESAAMEMLNGLDRSLAMIDGLETAQGAGTETHAQFDALRAEVNQLYGCLQFQDIIAQQLSGVAALLVDVEQRMATLAQLFDHPATGIAAGAGLAAADPETYNPDATTRNVAERQALVDEAFGLARPAR